MDLRVLLIESEPDDMLFLHEVLQEIEDGRWLPEWPRIAPLSASTWEDAERILSSDPPHVILFDLDSAKQGVGTFHLMQARAPDVPVILVLNSADEPLAVKLVRGGAEDFLLKKTIDCAPLAHALRNAVLRHRLLTSARAAARTDALTGLYNRAGFVASAIRDRMLAERLGRRWMVLIAEPRNLTEIAAAFGEQRRDLELMESADHLRSVVTPADTVARIAEQQFAISIFDTEAESVDQAWIRIRNAVGEHRIELGASIFHGQNQLSVDAMLEQALANLQQGGESMPGKSNPAGAA